MKKLFAALFALFVLCANVFAYDPPAGGQNVLRLTSPELITSANSSAGGGIFGVTPDSIINNPALTAWEQRITLDAAGTLLLSTNSDDNRKLGFAVEGGLLIPSRWCVMSTLFQGIWSEYVDMPVGNSVNASLAFSKDVTDQVSVGISGNFGFVYGDNDSVGSDWTASGAVGAFYNFGDLFFMRNLRFGAAMSNIGKMYSKTKVFGIKSVKDYNDGKPVKESESWPGLCTVRTGVAASFVKTSDFELGASIDFAYPSFQNVVVDTGLQIQIKDFLKISSSWEFDVMEFTNGAKNIMPSIGASFKFRFKSKEGSYLARKGWAESDMTVSTAYKLMYKNIHALSAGAVMNLGLEDTKAPEVILWGEE